MQAMHQALSATEPTRSRRVRHCLISADEVMEPMWIVLANESRLRVFELQADGRFLHEIVDFLSPKGRMRSEKVLGVARYDLLASNNSAGADADADEDRTSSTLVRQGDLFSRQVSGFIERARRTGRFAKLHIIGSGEFIELLRENMTEAAKRILEKELVKDVLNFERPVLEKYLTEIYAPLRTRRA